MKKLLIPFIALLFAASLLIPLPSFAQPIAGEQGLVTLSNEACYKTGDCTLCDVLQIVNNVIKLMLGLVGALAFIMFLYGGFQLMFKGAQFKKVGEGWATIKYAFLGLLLVFFSYALVNFGLNLIIVAGGGTTVNYTQPAKIFGTTWSEVCAEKK